MSGTRSVSTFGAARTEPTGRFPFVGSFMGSALRSLSIERKAGKGSDESRATNSRLLRAHQFFQNLGVSKIFGSSRRFLVLELCSETDESHGVVTKRGRERSL